MLKKFLAAVLVAAASFTFTATSEAACGDYYGGNCYGDCYDGDCYNYGDRGDYGRHYRGDYVRKGRGCRC